MSAVRILAELGRLSWLQARADRLPLALPAYALACVALVPLASHLSLGSGSRAAWEVGLLLQWLLMCAAGGWLGLRAVGLELERRTAALVLSGPVGPGTWLLGRALGGAALLAGLAVGLQAIWCAVCLWRGLDLRPGLVAYSAALFTEGAVLGALTALISSRTRPLVASGAAAGLWVAGHLSGEYSRLTEEWSAGWVAAVVYTAVPDLDLLDLQTPLVTGAPLESSAVLTALLYGLAWFVGLGALTVISVRSRDLA